MYTFGDIKNKELGIDCEQFIYNLQLSINCKKFQKQTLAHGTTTACYFASLYEDSSLILADLAIQYGQRALIGKINMITFAPPDYVETREESLAKTKSFIKAIKEKKVGFQ